MNVIKAGGRIFLVLCCLGLVGCASMERRERRAVLVDRIIEQCKNNAPQEQILILCEELVEARIKRDDYSRLRANGVPRPVLVYIENYRQRYEAATVPPFLRPALDPTVNVNVRMKYED